MATENTLLERLSKVQTALKAPKGQYNDFGKYKYRSCEDILEALKPLLAEQSLNLTLSDEILMVGERYYVKAIAEVNPVSDPSHRVTSFGYAREEDTRKGMGADQLTGAASSYARKYALNGLFLIDDTKDSDATNDHGKKPAEDKVAADVHRIWQKNGTEKPTTSPSKPSTGLIHPALMTELREALKGAQITGDAATAFVKSILGYETPKTNEDAQKLIDAVKKLVEGDPA